MVREGYKQTEVGVIPEDWCVVTLGGLGSFSKGAGVKKAETNSGDLNCVRYGELYTKHHDVIREFHSKISLEVALTSKPLKFGDILFACSGETKEEIGKCAAFVGCDVAYAGGDIIILSPRKDYPIFLGYLLNSPKVSSQKAKTGQGDAVVHTNASALSKITIPLPSLDEQKAIAEALSDVDGLIASLEALIAKKRALKTATMQQLLTGKTRLDGFGVGKGMKQTELGEIPEDWEVKTLSQLSDVRDGTHDSPKEQSAGVPLVTSKNITSGKLDFSNITFISKEASIEIDKRSKVDVGDIIMSMIGTLGNVACIKTKPDFCIKNVALFKPKNISQDFLYFYLSGACFQKILLDSLDGGIQKFVSLGTLRELSIAVPCCEEQNAISEILLNFDMSLQASSFQLAKTKALKQGMMQELLTGRTRLV